MKHLSDPSRVFQQKSGTKRAANLSIDAETLAEAKAMGINLSQTLEDELRRRVQQARIERWSRDNKAAIESYNRFIEDNGVWSEEYRKW